MSVDLNIVNLAMALQLEENSQRACERADELMIIVDCLDGSSYDLRQFEV